ncbi:hypothetical protein BGZ96_009384 [Linnemannia gamsii]|uniref:Kinesin-like protein n=1 Tax=Linnemannia gamsii TaxID=64522 RepID=A0ABQ7JWD3_9FUNG|nr:hypothetical protein BGZ96_009384 [Linnemannia gamsii]
MMYASPRSPGRPLPQGGQLPKPTGSSSGLLTPQTHYSGQRTPVTNTTSPGTSTNLRKISVSTPTTTTNTTTKPVLPPLATQQVAHVPTPSSHLDSHSSTPTTAATTPTAASTTAGSATPPGGSKTENVTVTVRIRPFSSSELKVAGGPTEIWTVGDAGSSIAYTDDYAVQARRVAVDYNYDHALTGSDNELIYNTSVKDLVQSAMEGYNGTVFAYGQTSSGKTYSGNESQPGITPRAVEDIFKYIRENSDREYLLRVSYLEIYNESIRDLLSPEAIDLRIHEDKRRGVYVSPLKEEIVTAPSQVMRIIERGNDQRHVSSTDFNAHSSRSHSIFQIVIESRDRSPATAGSPTAKPGTKSASAVRVSQLNLIDLAGSEKATSNEERRKEGAFINKSLLTLGTVISKLTEDKGARVSVICTISPSYLNVEESNNTLKFAARVKKIVTKAQTNQVMDDKALLEKYRREISELKAQLMLTAGDGTAAAGPGSGAAAPGPQQAELSSLLQKERRKHEEEMVEMNMVRNALKERIDHLTKLILTSSSVHTKGAAPDPPIGRNTVETSADGTVMEFPKEIESRLARKDTIVKELQLELESQQEKMALMKSALEKAVKGDAVDLEKTLARVGNMDEHNPPREKFLSEKRASIMNIKNLEEFDGVDGGDLAALKALQQQYTEKRQDTTLQRLDSRESAKSVLAIDNEEEDEDLKDTPWNREELHSLRQAKRELEIVVMDQERKLEDMVAFEDSDEFRELIIEMEEQREKIVSMEEEREGFRIMITELRNTIRKMEIAGPPSSSSSNAGANGSTSSAASTMAAAAAARIREVEHVAQKERRLRMEEQTRNMGRIASLEAELTMLKAELSVRNLADF